MALSICQMLLCFSNINNAGKAKANCFVVWWIVHYNIWLEEYVENVVSAVRITFHVIIVCQDVL